jgi:hypothetical protein
VGRACSAGACITDESDCSSSADCPPPAASCDGTVLVTYSGNGACTGGSCQYSPTRRTCGAGTFCDAARRTCSEVGTGGCTSDGQCEARASALGYTGDVACDTAVGCHAVGLCGAAGTVEEGYQDDPFGSGCRGSQMCSAAPSIDLLGGAITYAYRCTGCTIDGSDCRSGETCSQGFLDSSPTCQGPGGGFPFPFP